MANKATTHVIRGKAHWCKLLGAARPHTGDAQYDKGPYWQIDLTPNEAGIEMLKSILSKKHFAEKMKEPKGKDTRKEDFVSFKHYLLRKDGKTNDPIPVTDASGNAWPEKRDIGNESVVEILFRKVDFGTTVGLYIQKMRVLQLVEYDGGADFEPLSEDDEFFAAGAIGSDGADAESKAPNPDDFDDDVPF